MKIGVVGCGAMGGLFAAQLAQAGAEIWAFDVWHEHIEAISNHGLDVHGSTGRRLVRLQATSDPAAPGIADVVLFFVKSGQTRAAALSARPMIEANTLLVTLQNGLGNVDVLREIHPENALLFGFTPLTSEVLRPGVIRVSGGGRTCLWPDRGQPTPSMLGFCATLTQARIDVALTPDIEAEIWKKLVVNCCFNPVCALTGLTVGAVMAQPDSANLVGGILHEIVILAQAVGIPLQAEVAGTYLRDVATAAGGHFPSMVADVRARRPTEIDSLNGAVVRLCERHGIGAPCNRTLVALIRLMEAGWQNP